MIERKHEYLPWLSQIDNQRSMTPRGHEFGQPLRRVRSRRGHDSMHARDLAGAARDHGQFGVEALEVKLADHAAMCLLDEKHPRTRFELILDEFAFPFGQHETLRVLIQI